MKKFLSVLICLALLCSVAAIGTISSSAAADHEDFSLSATDFVKQIKVGWNLGNTLDATGIWGQNNLTSYTVNDIETGWGNPTTTQAMIDEVAKAGFNALRLPVSWVLWIDTNNNYKIKDEWLARVKQIVDYAYKNNMYVIVDVHHDDGQWLNIGASDEQWPNVLTEYKAVWQQIATYFKDYDEHLIFEGSNEMVNNGAWWGSDADLARVNEVHKAFVETVRVTGGNNDKRYLLLPGQGAQMWEHQWGAVVIPNDDKHCIIDVHWYSDKASESSECEKVMKPIYEKLISKGVPVIFGETGMTKSRSDKTKENWSYMYFSTAKKYDIPVFYWDDGGSFEFLNRETLQWNSPVMLNTIMKTIDGTYVPVTTQPTTALQTPENDGKYVASDDVYYDWSGSSFNKTEGWQANADNLTNITPEIDANNNCIWDLSDFNSQQLNSTWSYDTNDMKGKALLALLKAGSESGSGYLIFSVTLNGAKNTAGNDCGVYLAHNLGGITTGDRTIFVKNGETKDILIDISNVNNIPDTFNFKIQQFDEGLTSLNITISKISVAVEKPATLYGDANGDGNIDTKDVLVLRKYLANMDVTISKESADANADTFINTKDVLLLRKYLAGMSVTLGK